MGFKKKSWLLVFFLALLMNCTQNQPSRTSLKQSLTFLTTVHQSGVLDILPLTSNKLISIGRDSLVILWQVDSSRAIASKHFSELPVGLCKLPENTDSFWIFFANGSVIQASAANLQTQKRLDSPFVNPTSIAYYRPEKKFYFKSGTQFIRFNPQDFKLERLAFRFASNDGFAILEAQPLFAVFSGSFVQLLDLRGFKLIARVKISGLNPKGKGPRLLKFINNNLSVAAFGEDLWQIDWGNKQAQKLPRSHLATITTLTTASFSPLALSGAMDKSIKIWNMQTNELQASLYGHFFNINRLVVIDSLRSLFSASEDGTILLYDLKTYQIQKRLGSIKVALRSPWQLRIQRVYTARSFKVGDNEYNVSERGTRLLKVNAEIKNISPAPAIFFSSNFFVIDSADARTPCVGLENYVALDPEAYFKRQLAPGKSIKGTFVFIINQPYKNYRITYETLPPISLNQF